VTKVVVGPNEAFETALKRFNRKIQEDRILAEARRRSFFEPPCQERKRKRAAKRRKSLLQTRKSQRER